MIYDYFDFWHCPSRLNQVFLFVLGGKMFAQQRYLKDHLSRHGKDQVNRPRNFMCKVGALYDFFANLYSIINCVLNLCYSNLWMLWFMSCRCAPLPVFLRPIWTNILIENTVQRILTKTLFSMKIVNDVQHYTKAT